MTTRKNKNYSTVTKLYKLNFFQARSLFHNKEVL